MPRFYFHVEDKPSFTDEEGIELESTREARDQALDYAGQLLRESSEDHSLDGTPLIVRVTGEGSTSVMTIEVRVKTNSEQANLRPRPD